MYKCLFEEESHIVLLQGSIRVKKINKITVI